MFVEVFVRRHVSTNDQTQLPVHCLCTRLVYSAAQKALIPLNNKKTARSSWLKAIDELQHAVNRTRGCESLLGLQGDLGGCGAGYPNV